MSMQPPVKGRGPADFVLKTDSGIKMRPDNTNYMPQLGDGMAIICMIITCIIMAHGGLFGFISILVFYAMWLPRLRYRGIVTIRPTKDVITVTLFPLFACLSVLWSVAPMITAYTSLEYLSGVVCAIIIARVVSTLAYMRGLSLGAMIIIVASIASNRYGVDPFSGNYSLIGLFGSKNQVGLFAEIGIISGIISFFRPQRFISRIFFCMFPVLICCAGLYLSKSASSTLSLCLVFVVIGGVYLVTRLPRKYRGFACTMLMVWFVTIIAAGAAMNWQEAVLQAFGKNATLTGRTFLWDKGMESAMHTPLLGHGYNAFWILGNPVAEQLWYKFDIDTRQGFHFHNVYVEIFVELGAIGLFLLVLLMLNNIFQSLKLVLKHGMRVDYIFTLAIIIMLFVRSFVEADIWGTFSIGPILFYSIIPRYLHKHSIKA